MTSYPLFPICSKYYGSFLKQTAWKGFLTFNCVNRKSKEQCKTENNFRSPKTLSKLTAICCSIRLQTISSVSTDERRIQVYHAFSWSRQLHIKPRSPLSSLINSWVLNVDKTPFWNTEPVSKDKVTSPDPRSLVPLSVHCTARGHSVTRRSWKIDWHNELY